MTIGYADGRVADCRSCARLFTLKVPALRPRTLICFAPDGTQTLPPVFAAQSGTCKIAVPIDVAASSVGQVFLILFGTGIRGAGGDVSASVNGMTSRPLRMRGAGHRCRARPGESPAALATGRERYG